MERSQVIYNLTEQEDELLMIVLKRFNEIREVAENKNTSGMIGKITIEVYNKSFAVRGNSFTENYSK